MPRLGRLGWWELGLVLLVSACGVSDDGLWVPTAQPVVILAETEVVQDETPPAGGGATESAEVEAVSTRMPAVIVEPEGQVAAADKVGADSGPTEEQARLLAGLEDYGLAPELHNEVWLNSEPLSLDDLRGKVVMVEFWTFG